MNLSHLPEILTNEPGYRLKQIKKAVFSDFVTSWDQVMELPKTLRETLNNECPLEIQAETQVSQDENTVKTLIRLPDDKLVETVLIKHATGRNTVCISTMVGCPMKCAFCATGSMGFSRSLTTDEIIEQVLFFSRLLKDSEERVGSIVFMGMGEPLLNYDNVISAVRVLNDALAFGIGIRHISISTCGIIDGIKKLQRERAR